MEEQVQAVLAASRVLSAVVAESVTPIADHVTLAQYRALLIVAANGPINLNAVAAALGVHPSNATRACDRLVDAGLLARTESAVDRRRVELSLTAAGRFFRRLGKYCPRGGTDSTRYAHHFADKNSRYGS